MSLAIRGDLVLENMKIQTDDRTISVTKGSTIMGKSLRWRAAALDPIIVEPGGLICLVNCYLEGSWREWSLRNVELMRTQSWYNNIFVEE